MAHSSTEEKKDHGEGRLDSSAVLSALALPVLVLEPDNRVASVNLAAEQLLATSAAVLTGQFITSVLPSDSPLLSLAEQVRSRGYSVSETDITLESPRIGTHLVAAELSPIPEKPGTVVVCLSVRSMARRMEDQQVHRNAARSVTAMAAMLAHEVKNPLSGIRGAAQLLESSVAEEDRELTRLICEESDRIVGLVDRMEMFSSQKPIERKPVNIHEVLGHVRRLAENGFADRVRFVERYDPSLPPVLGNRDLLIQALLNLVKNAAEAADPAAPEIQLRTGYQQGVRLALPGGEARVDLPLMVGVQDNGPGISEDMKSNLFDPFVTSKPGGKGLGLALVAKIVDDHGGMIEVDSEPRRTLFRMMLPMADTQEAGS